jgi:hypothetical protein
MEDQEMDNPTHTYNTQAFNMDMELEQQSTKQQEPERPAPTDKQDTKNDETTPPEDESAQPNTKIRESVSPAGTSDDETTPNMTQPNTKRTKTQRIRRETDTPCERLRSKERKRKTLKPQAQNPPIFNDEHN